MGESILQAMTEFGAAGLIGILWILERRHASKRDRQLDEAHRLLNTQGRELEIWLRLVSENTKALSGLERTQRELIEMLQSWRRRSRSKVA